jgi:hypothetical protein
MQPDPSAHSDCIRLTAGRNVMVRNVRFEGGQHSIAVARIDWNAYGASMPCGKNDRVVRGDG